MSTPYYTKFESDFKEQEVRNEIEASQELSENKTDKGGFSGTSQDLKDQLDNAVFNAVKTYDTLAEAQAVSPAPEDGTAFKVSNITDVDNAGDYTFQSSSPDGTRFEREFFKLDIEKVVDAGKNLYNAEDVTLNKNVNPVDGNLYEDTGEVASNYIEIQASTTYHLELGNSWATYDKDFVRLSGSNTEVINTPANAKYFRFSMNNSRRYYCQLELGSVFTEYEIYRPKETKEKLPEDYVANKATDALKEEVRKGLLPTNELFKNKSEFIYRTLPTTTNFSFQSGNFSGWGSGVGVRDAFRAIVIKLNAWSLPDTPTEVTVRIRENDYFGTILATTKVPFSNVSDGFLEVQFDNIIDSIEPLFVEYLTDGKVGVSYGNLDVGQGGTTLKYIDNSNTNSSTYKGISAGTSPVIMVEFYSLSDEFTLNDYAKTEFQDVLPFDAFIPRISLPDAFSAVVGYTRQLYFNSIIEAINPYNYNIKVTGTVGGKQYPRYYEFTPSATGAKTLTISLYNNKNELITSKTCTVNFISPAVSPASAKKVLCVGDSLTSSGTWTGEFLRMLTQSGGTPSGLNLANIDFIGTVDKGSGNKFEGYGGKNWNYYAYETTVLTDVEFNMASHDKENVDLVSIWQESNGNQWRLETINSPTKISFSRVNHSASALASGTLTHVSGATNTTDITYTSTNGGVLNPFYNTTTDALDFQNYVTENSFGSIDYALFLLTWNGLSGLKPNASDHATFITDAKVVLDQLKADYPNVKVIISGVQLPSKNGGLGVNYGDANSGYGNYYDLVQNVNGLNQAYQDLANEAGYSDYVTFVHLSSQFDSENNMPQADHPVNLRNTTTEKRGTNGVHPTTNGYLQISDAMFNEFNKVL